ncbi:HAD-IIB family hydrolase [Paraburkholderia sp. BCC1886]|uniref:HAD-IIB family hydrolase n=1 Tax=Paraburkholderia sp. BCC1886 TaxID=2562670 RepID=UPI001181E1C8|nr:HAD-IIB family hydrolase [Paraburkholderia sp. BCC1886]
MLALDHFRDCSSIHTVFTDIDDTLTTDGVLLADTYHAMERLHAAGVRVVPVTGRPAGWCDHIARMWPIDGVIGENGAFYYWYDRASGKLRERHVFDHDTRRGNAGKLDAVRARILDAVPECAVASDQFCRLYDLAIDFCEDVPPLADDKVTQIAGIMREAGMTAKVSSIHVNGWFGAYDKLTMTQRFAAEVWGDDLDALRAHSVFAGDSPNDEPMFGYFPHSVGVANVRQFVDRMDTPPAYVTHGAGGHGFAELADHLLAHRQS